MNTFKYDKDANDIVTITMDMTGPVNAMNAEFRESLIATVDRLQQENSLSGVIFASAKKVFFAGGDLNDLLATTKDNVQEFMHAITIIKSNFRVLEKLPVPVVAAINGAALGGGLELALACNYRIAVDTKAVQIGFPEVTLGLLPGGGGVVRTVHMLGLEKALPHLLEGRNLNAQKALTAGFVNELVASQDELLPRAIAYILEHKDNELAAQQPWDVKGHRIPGGNANSPKLAQVITMAPAMLKQKTRGLLPAPEQILDVAIEAARLDFDVAQRVETRGFTYLVTTPEAKNMITTFFFQLNQLNAGASRPKDIEKTSVKKVGILGAGMMGQGIAYVSAMAGIAVVLKDTSVENAEKGKAYSEKLLAKRVSRGKMDDAKKSAILGLIQTTDSNDDLGDCDLVIEAVFENIDLKNKITQATESHLPKTAVWGSNTSTLPITELAEASAQPENFIGIHFFSPVDKMPLVEIICGKKTSDKTLAKAYDYTKQIRKTPIVVNDSLGFFTSRTFGTYLDEGVRILLEGANPVRIDNLGKAIGMPVGPLAVHDEVSLELTRKAAETWKDMGVEEKWGERAAMREIIQTMVTDNKRGGRYHGGGFYEYAEDGSKTIWPKLYDLYFNKDYAISDADIKDRLLFRSVIETLKCLETGVLRSVADANIGSIMGIGAPVWTGGYIQFVNTYGLQKFVERCAELEAKYGERFKVPAIVNEKIKANALFV